MLMKRVEVDLTEEFECCSLKEISQHLLGLIQKYGEDCDVYLTTEESYEDTTAIVYLTYDRPYTQGELDEQQRRKDDNEQRELEVLKRLTKKYGAMDEHHPTKS